MSDNINKSSISATINSFATDLEKWVLNPEEKLNEEPSSFISLVSSTLGKTSAYSFFNMMMSKRELNPSTAVLTKSLLRQLRSDDLNGIYGTPSSIPIVISYPQDILIKKAISTGVNNQSKLTLNKNTLFNIGSYPLFTLDYNIDIIITKYHSANSEPRYSIYAKYNTDDPEAGDVISVNNPYIYTRNDIIYNNQKHFTMYIDAKQYTRSVVLKEMSGEAKSFSVAFSGSLMGFVVLYKSQSATEFSKIPVYLEGDQAIDGVSYTVTNNSGASTIRLKFSKLPKAFNPTNGVIKVITYTTEGRGGNFTIAKFDESNKNEFGMMTGQDLGDVYQEALNSVIPTTSIAGNEASGGKNAMSLDEIRALVIASKQGEVVTPATLDSASRKNGFTAVKKQHDLLSFSYLLSSYLKSSADGSIIPTKMIDGYFEFSDLAIDKESNSRIITPSDAFDFNKDESRYDLIQYKNLSSYKEYYNTYINNYDKIQYSFPYFIRIKNNDTVDIKIYNESINSIKNTQFTYIADSILDKTSISSVLISRNPVSSSLIEDADGKSGPSKNFYLISFGVNLSEVLYDHLKTLSESDDPYVKFRIFLKNKSDNGVYARDINLKDCIFKPIEKSITCLTYIETNNNILDDGKINICNNSIKALPLSGNTQYPFYYIDNTIDIEVCSIFKNVEGEHIKNAKKYEDYLTDTEKLKGYYVGIVYSVEDVKLAEDITDYINIVGDLKLSQPKYEIAEEDIPDTYSENEYKTDPVTGKLVSQSTQVILANGEQSSYESYVLLHSSGDIKRSLNGRVGTYNVSDLTWSSEETGDGVYDTGNVLGGNAIYAIAAYNGLIIFGGEDGRIGCYDVTYGNWHTYNNKGFKFRGANNVGEVNNGITPIGDQILGSYVENGVTKFSAIRGFKIVDNVLIAYGDYGRVSSFNLKSTDTTNSWKSPTAGTGGDSKAIYYDSGKNIGYENIYTCELIKNEDNTSSLLFAGGAGRISKLNLGKANGSKSNEWVSYEGNYNENHVDRSSLYIYSNGSERGYKTILSMKNYNDSLIFCTGLDGIVSVIKLSDGSINILNDGSASKGKTMYSSVIAGNYFVEAGKDGYISSYDIIHGTWNVSGSLAPLSDDGKYIGNLDINYCLNYGTNVLFCGEDGRVSVYDTTSNTFEAYDSISSKMSNDGSCVKSSISCAIYDSSSDSDRIYFAGKSGNIVYKYRKGDIIYDNEGNAITKSGTEGEKVLYLKGIPCYSRLFNVETSFFDISKSYSNLMDKIKSMNSIFIDTGSLYLGVKKSAGSSNLYYFINPTNNEKVFLDSLSLSFKLGVKFNNEISEENSKYLVNDIKNSIINYINYIQENNDIGNVEFNINKMLEYIKDEVPGIDYFEIYKINNYSPNECQTIYYDSSSDSNETEYLSVQKIVDISTSNFTDNLIYFKSDIDINIL